MSNKDLILYIELGMVFPNVQTCKTAKPHLNTLFERLAVSYSFVLATT
jgi:hypothetical protein